MIPSAVAHEARENLLNYLRTTYDLADETFERALLEFLRGPDGLFRGPFLDVRLPFRTAREGAVLPLEIAPPFSVYSHQEKAFQRLHGQRGHQPQHTLVTTGTGSGKTECFLYPVLDHCYRERKAGRKGIKAILLYPMNALASDQARRIAKELWDDPRLKQAGVSAGLYVGGKGSHQVADREHLIDDRRILRQAPPDILLTNYKMLDYLLVRPEDRSLWEQNAPRTLQFLVLDELHTYDGAQGSDVACLVRRLKARVKTPEGGLCCIGTSATIGEGDEASKEQLTRFATEIFDERFYSDSVICEERLRVDEALDGTRELELHPAAGDEADLEPRGKDALDWLARQQELWFGPDAAGLTPLELGSQLRKHEFTDEVLRALDGKPRSIEELGETLAKRVEWFAELGEEQRALVLDSFVGLISSAKRLSRPNADGEQREQPFLTVQVQLWMREVRSLVRAVAEAPRFQWESELGGRRARAIDETRYLPQVRCRECGCVGMASVEQQGRHMLLDDSEERQIGRAWFERQTETRFLVLGHGPPRLGQRAIAEYLCPHCLVLGTDLSCACRGSNVACLPVRVGREQSDSKHPKFKPTCPDCGAEDTLIFLASRASSLLSVAVSHLYQTKFNDDKKLLAFVDSVQDASHRAGFFGARTYRFNLRALVQELVQAQGGVPLEGIGERLLQHTRERVGDGKAIALLVPEDLRGHEDYEAFRAQGGGRPATSLRDLLAKRLSLEVAFEYGYSVRSGRSLEKSGCSTLEVDAEAMSRAASELAMIVSEDGFLQSRKTPLSDDEARHFLAGLLNRLRLRGGIQQELLEDYVRAGGDRRQLLKRHNPIGPVFARDAVLPRFLFDRNPSGRRTAFDSFVAPPKSWTWYRDWAVRFLDLESKDDGVDELYREGLRCLEAAGILRSVETSRGLSAWGLDPAALRIVAEVRELVCPACKGVVRLPAGEAERWRGRTCTSYRCLGSFSEPQAAPESFYTRTFREGRVAGVFPEEHTGLLKREARERLEEEFKSGKLPDAPNLLVCTPTLEMGIDIGDLSAVFLCTVPPTTSNYLQRIGRAGRATGNAVCLTMATNRPHDLYFHADPALMMAGAVDPPGCFLNAPEMLKRQIVAHAMDAWAATVKEIDRLPAETSALLVDGSKFPALFLDYFDAHKEVLVEDFLERFDPRSLSEDSREQLRQFALSGQVRERFLAAFDAVKKERARLQGLQRRARQRLEDLEDAQDLSAENLAQQRKELEHSHRMYGRLIKELGKKYPLNVLTDAGVLPNYAFPEQGVELDSVVRVGDGETRRYDTYQYVRAASVAIRELAPFNSFYAEGRRVTIDELDIGTKNDPLLETWRMCALCSHAERDEDGAAPASGCPTCGDAGWADVGRCRKLLYFRRSRSIATRLEAASADATEERDSKQYQTLDLIEVTKQNHNGARVIESLPFGYELLVGLKLREVNFGLRGEASFPVGGESVNEEGFQVCLDCGRVRPEDGKLIVHTPTCRTNKNKQVGTESVYLYREVESEAIRLLLPVAEHDLEVRRASFQAALELGMRLRFGGRAPHLRIKTMSEPVRGGGRRNFLVIFDTVPGGTGFLADLGKEGAIMTLLQQTLDALQACRCLHQEDGDGCYRCLYAFQNQRELELTSSRTAQEMIRSILAVKDELAEIDTLSDVTLDSLLESELEERFQRLLVARARKHGSAEKEIVKGAERWRLTINERVWELRPQPDLGPTQGVALPCRPDFLLTLLSTDIKTRPVAVFCDGFAYHAQPEQPVSRLGDDIEKRRAILESGRYRVWSMNWNDVGEFGDEGEGLFRSLLSQRASQAANQVMTKWGLSPVMDRAGKGNMELLWSWLQSPDEDDWRRKVAAIGVAFTVDAQTLPTATIGHFEDALLGEDQPGVAGEPQQVAVTKETEMLGQLRMTYAVALLGRMGTAVFGHSTARSPVWSLRLLDDQARRRDPRFQESWRQFLQGMNLLQFAEGADFRSTETIQRLRDSGVDIYPLQRPTEGYSVAAEPSGEPGVSIESPSARAVDPLEDLGLSEDEYVLAKAVLAAGGTLPEAGFELWGASGRCLAQAALAWPAIKIAVLFAEIPADELAFETAGWRVFQGIEEHDALVTAVTTDVGA